MCRRAVDTIGLTVAAAFLAASSAAADSAGANVRTFVERFGFSAAEITSLESGRVASRFIATRDGSDLAIVGAVRVRAPIERLLATAEIQAAVRVGELLQTGLFGRPPRAADLSALRFEARDLDDVRECRPQDCSFKLDEAGLALVAQVDWKSGTAHARFAALYKEWLAERMAGYQQDGRLSPYLDKDSPVSGAEELRRSLDDSPYLAADSPFLRYVVRYPHASLPRTEDVFYWSKEKVRKPVTSAHHLVIHRGPEGEPAACVVADKHLSDTHYFRSYLVLMWLLPDGAGGFYLVRLDRTRIDPPRLFAGLILRRIKSATKAGLDRSLTSTRSRLEDSVDPAAR